MAERIPSRIVVAENVKRLRAERGLSIARLAELSGVPADVVAEIEAGTRDAWLFAEVLPLAECLGCYEDVLRPYKQANNG